MLTDQAESLRKLVMDADPEPADVPEPSRRAKAVAVTSGKGGVGKSSISLNLAVQLSQMGRRVVVLDADLGTANIDVLCNLSPARTLAHVIAGLCQLSDAVVEAPGGFLLVPGASGLAQIADLNDGQRQRVIDQLLELERSADLILVDTGAGVGPNVLTFAASCDQLLVVTTPEPTAMADAYAVVKTAHRRRKDIDVRVLVNLVRDPSEGRAVFARMEAVCRNFLSFSPRYVGHVLVDQMVGAAVRQRVPFILAAPQCRASGCIRQLAHRMVRHPSDPTSTGFLRRMAGWLDS